MKSFLWVALCVMGPMFAEEEPSVQRTSFDSKEISNTEVSQPEKIDNGLEKPRFKNENVAITLSSILPGLGNLYVGNFKEAYILMGGVLGSSYGAVLAAQREQIEVATNLLSLVGNIGMYGIYAAYRDARVYNQALGKSYRSPLINESLNDCFKASFQPRVVFSSDVWKGYLGFMGGAIIWSLMVFQGEQLYHKYRSSSQEVAPSLAVNETISTFYPIAAFPIAVGEEAFFRGYLQSYLLEKFSPRSAIVLSSIAFGLVHIPNAFIYEEDGKIDFSGVPDFCIRGLPVVTALGAYLGWISYKNHSLKQSIALHAWYDFTLFSIVQLARKGLSASTHKHKNFRVSFDF